MYNNIKNRFIIKQLLHLILHWKTESVKFHWATQSQITPSPTTTAMFCFVLCLLQAVFFKLNYLN